MIDDNIVTLHIRKVPKSLRDDFKALCSKRGETMQDAVKRMVEQTLTKEDGRMQRLYKHNRS